MLAEQRVLAASRLSAPKKKEDFIVENLWGEAREGQGADKDVLEKIFWGSLGALYLPQTSVPLHL